MHEGYQIIAFQAEASISIPQSGSQVSQVLPCNLFVLCQAHGLVPDILHGHSDAAKDP